MGGYVCGYCTHTGHHSHKTIIIANNHPSIHLIRKYCAYKAVLCMFMYKYAYTVASVRSLYGEPLNANFRAEWEGLCRLGGSSRKNMLQNGASA